MYLYCQLWLLKVEYNTCLFYALYMRKTVICNICNILCNLCNIICNILGLFGDPRTTGTSPFDRSHSQNTGNGECLLITIWPWERTVLRIYTATCSSPWYIVVMHKSTIMQNHFYRHQQLIPTYIANGECLLITIWSWERTVLRIYTASCSSPWLIVVMHKSTVMQNHFYRQQQLTTTYRVNGECLLITIWPWERTVLRIYTATCSSPWLIVVMHKSTVMQKHFYRQQQLIETYLVNGECLLITIMTRKGRVLRIYTATCSSPWYIVVMHKSTIMQNHFYRYQQLTTTYLVNVECLLITITQRERQCCEYIP